MQPGSLFTTVGCDNGRRTGAIGLVTYTLPGILVLLFGSGHWLWLPGMLLAALFGLSLVRRCRDAHRPRGYLVAALVPLPFWLLVLSMAGNAALGLICFALGLGITLLVSVLPSRPAKDYVDGYWSADMPVPEPLAPRREPTLGAEGLDDAFDSAWDDPDEDEAEETSVWRAASRADHDTDISDGKAQNPRPDSRYRQAGFHDDRETEQAKTDALAVFGMSATRDHHLALDASSGIKTARPRTLEEPVQTIEARHSHDIDHHHQDAPIWQQFTQRRAAADVRDDDMVDDESFAGNEAYGAEPAPRPLRSWSDAFNGDGSLEVLMEAIYLHLKNWWRFYLSGAAALLLMAAVVAIGTRLSGTTEAPLEAADNTEVLAAQTTRLESGLVLTLDKEALILSWRANSGSSGIIWSLATAEGERHCASLLFNNGNRYRPMQVADEQGMRRARFSPLDTQSIVRDLALRGNVQLCGQGFSLKGSQAAIEGHQAFAGFLTP
ncbi:hypothetical protein [Shewanella litorisediminis]|uniref:DUF805 domain-containing protein n=1 Tax=Shewanella litorisediminis TaxID=1173586 RepID=A0ABX7G4C7_9GAMM|nr:hypothetical protein [Shewanella litorisediminis]MCL2920115.1 hypothetical protein [Shewanella litorisediminis]QRH02103.1 hypothetical protein JQC75_01335 [Shewanella litorisediminis]